MNHPSIEHRVLELKRINADLINEIRDRYALGPAVIITDNPRALVSIIRKQWIRETAFLAKARASTLDVVKIARLSRELLVMETLRFDAKGSEGILADVYLLSPQQLDLIPATCANIYLMPDLALDPNKITMRFNNLESIAIIYYSAPRPEVLQK